MVTWCSRVVKTSMDRRWSTSMSLSMKYFTSHSFVISTLRDSDLSCKPGRRKFVRKRRGLLMGGSLIAPNNDREGPELVVVMSFMYGTQDTRIGMTGMVGVIDPEWATWRIERKLLVDDLELKR